MPTTIVVVPCYNEADRLPVARFRRFVRACPDVHFLLVDDGSTDATQQVIEQLIEQGGGRISGVQLPENSGKAEAVRRGMLEAFSRQPDFAAFFDADLATPLEEIPRFCRLLERRPQVDLVIGSRIPLLGREIDRHPIRRFIGRTFSRLASWGVGLSLFDTQCGAKMFRATHDVARLFASPFAANWIFDVEILARLVAQRGREQAAQALYELPLDCWREIPGSKLKLSDFPKAGLEFLEILRRYRWSSPAQAGTIEIPAPGLTPLVAATPLEQDSLPRAA